MLAAGDCFEEPLRHTKFPVFAFINKVDLSQVFIPEQGDNAAGVTHHDSAGSQEKEMRVAGGVRSCTVEVNDSKSRAYYNRPYFFPSSVFKQQRESDSI